MAGLYLPRFQDATSVCMLKWSLADACEHLTALSPVQLRRSLEWRGQAGDGLGSQIDQWSPAQGKEVAMTPIFPSREE